MTAQEFNNKYDNWLQDGHYGLAIDDENIIEFLDNIFQDLTRIPSFSYAQIKMKFDHARFYADGVSSTMCYLIEHKINEINRNKP